MANNIEINFLLKGIQDSLNGIKKFESSAAQSLSKVEDSFGLLKKAAIGFIGIFAANKIISFGESIIRSASEQEDAINSLNIALAASGKFSKAASQDLQEFASQLQRTSKFGDEAVLSSAALIESLTNLDTEGLKKATQGAADLASALKIDLSTASSLVAKAVEGNVGALKRYGITAKEGATQSETLANVLKALNNQFGGAAAGQLNTFSGALAKAKNAYGDIFEEAGSVITQNSAVIGALRAAGDIFERVTAIVKENKGAISALIADGIKSLISIVPTAVGSLELFNQAFLKIVEGTNLVRKGINQVTGFFAAIGSGSGGTEIAKAVQEDNKAIDESTKKARENAAVRTQLIGKVANSVQKITDETVKNTKAGQVNAEQFIKNADESVIAAERLKEELKKTNEIKTKFFSEAVKNPFAALSGKIETPKIVNKAELALTVAGGFIQDIAKGAKGVTDLITQGLTAAFGPIGAVAGQIFDVLSQGPEKVREMVTAFVENIPVIIENIIASIPELILALLEKIPDVVTAFIERIPEIITAFVDRIPEIAIKLIEALIKLGPALAAQAPFIAVRLALALAAEAPKIAVQFVTELVKEAPRFISEMIAQIAKQIGSLGGLLGGGGGGGGIGGAIGGIGKSVGKIFGFADGGEVPGGPPFVDKVPALLAPKENVLTGDLSQELRQFMRSQSSGGQRQPLTVILQVDRAQLASVMVELERDGFRLKP